MIESSVREWVKTDMKHILEHPALSVDAKAGYLLRVLRDGRDLNDHMTIATAYQELHRFVSDYVRSH